MAEALQPEALGSAIAAWRVGRFAEAERLCREIVDRHPDYFDALHLMGVCQVSQGRTAEALTSYERALALQPRHAQALCNRGVALHALRREDEALASVDQALAAAPGYVDALYNRGSILAALGRHEAAVDGFDRLLAIQPAHAGALNNRGNSLQALLRHAEAVASFDHALALKPGDADTLYNRGIALQSIKRHDAALASFDQALARNPAHPYALNGVADCVAKLCDWDRRENVRAELISRVTQGPGVVFPFPLIGYDADPALTLACARRFTRDKFPTLPPPIANGPRPARDRIRMAYLSGDFRRHPMGHLTVRLLELHDKARFETIAISFGPDDGSDIRARIAAGVDDFRDVRGQSDEAVARLIDELGVDIAIDLMGYTQDSRPGILAHRPAPVQVNWLGAPLTMGAPFIDYIIADPTVLPFTEQPFYSEEIVHLPNTYQSNDDRRVTADRTPTRAEAGLPDQGFVFCCFNNAWKITPAMFDIWMRLLQRTQGAVLWLFRDHEIAEANLRREAQKRGIDPARLVFAQPLPYADHLARHRLADLFLDTLPYNAHTTASDALWMGLPLLTCPGEAFTSRVAASLLKAAGVAELIAGDPAAYETMALDLAADPARMAALKAKIAGARETCALFDAERFARDIEAAYTRMWRTSQTGEAPKGFAAGAG